MRAWWAAFGLLWVSCAGDDGGGANGTGTTGVTDTGASTSPDDGDDGSEAGPGSGTASMDDTSTTDGPTTADDSDSSDATTEGPPDEPGPIVVYVVDGGSSVQLWSVDDDQANVTMRASYDTGPSSAELALHPDGRHLYVAARNGPGHRVISYEIDPADGTLSELGVTDIGLDPVYLSIDPGGHYAFSCDFGGDQVAAWALGDDFVLESTPLEVIDTPDEPHSIVPHHSLDFVYVPHRTPNLIDIFQLDPSSGQLTIVSTVDAPSGAGARHIVFHPDGEHAYLSDEFASAVTHFTVDQVSGELTTVASHSTLPMDFMGGNTCADVHITPNGKSVYVSNRGHDSLAMFAVADDGTLTDLGQIATEQTPREFDVDPTGRFVFSLGQSSGNMATYTIEDSGELTAGAVVNIGPEPLWALALELPAR